MARKQPKTTDNLVQEIDYERPWLYEKQERGLFNDASISCIEASTKSGKAQPVDATVYTQFGPKDMGDIQVGDKVIGADGEPTEVVGVYPQGEKKVYRVTFTDGSSTECTADHLWAVYNEWMDWDDYRLMTLADIQEEIPLEEYSYTYIPPHSAVQFMVQNTSDDPYDVGKYLSRYGRVSSDDVDLKTGIEEPRIPDEYKYNTIFVREQVITGIFSQIDGGINLSRFPDSLSSDIREVLLSLGASGDDRGTRAFENIEYIGEKECKCIEVSSRDGLYLTDDFIVTHNTLGALIWLFEQALKGEPNENYWWVAPFSSQADIAWRRMKNMVPTDIYEKNETVKRMDLINGTSIWFKSGDNEEGLYGEDVYGVVIDEASRLKRSAWVAIRTTMTYTQGKVRAIGNVRGMQNWFYKLCRQAESSDEDRYHYEKITALDAAEAGVIPWQAIVEAKKDLTDDEFKELYLAEPSDDVGNPFGIENITKCVMTDAQGDPISSPRGGAPVAWGWDLGRHENFTAGVALDADGNVCDMERFKAPYDTMVRRIVNATGGTTALVDSTGSGDPLLDRIRKEGGENFRSFTFSGKSKPNLMTGLATAIQNREIAIPDGQLRTELEAFEYERKDSGNVVYRSPKKDDLVDALALAVKLWRQRTVYPSDVSPLSLGKVSSWKM